jgi:hypothetical protein
MAHATCLFCQQSGATVKITKEHVLPGWLDEVLTPAVVGPDMSIVRTMTGADGTTATETWEPRKVAGVEVRSVCATCNNGWMCGYDGTVRPWLEPMILGFNQTLTIDQQLTIATWATMKAMVLEFGWGRGKPTIFTQEDRDILMTQRRPPASVQVRVAALESQGVPVRVFHRVYVRGNPVPQPKPDALSLCVTFVIGCFVVQVFGGPAAGDGGLRREPVAASTYLQLYPPAHGTLQWPPAKPLDDSQIEAFGNPLRV